MKEQFFLAVYVNFSLIQLIQYFCTGLILEADIELICSFLIWY